ncbi:MAG: 50S ribosomal protein L3 N(5)-glutamine methyltransferase [Gammaproteobacteria bacterium]|jgi:ribosomal protein L3 glutamine methyltransferase|uniref:50S ribosomal protein L3 N(5)-glutamine methyltransferase n=2 Tax=Halochromatium glycolicum TaxID=85075 RepID=A0AAJ0U811_9GAMM|nr:50S ribosomal protein L3 N(5)-glutamine methyltransferase [Halochromatium glycolicum]MBK1706903.1 50S ribosomal protein L3 N(5)-glutamine methyltransferase [Halochromatium glycolicum]NBC47867.1 50S ribosomal protein L3 N(5)-glutamine methyltransferase [Gammaproteobacteria bacterium]
MNDLQTIRDWVRWGGCRFTEAGLHFGHGTDNAFDEAAWLVAHALKMPPTLIAEYGACHLTGEEREAVAALIARRIDERCPAAYLTGRTWFAGLEMTISDQVMVPRSPLAELIVDGFSPWADPTQVNRVLDLCTGSGCIGIAAAIHLPDADVDLADISPAALRVAMRNRSLHGLEDRVRVIESDLFAAIDEDPYDVIVSNPPYVAAAELESLPAEYRHEPTLAFAAGESGLDLVLRILRDAPDFLADDGLLIVEVGSAAETLQDRFPTLHWTWLEFDHGGDGVFLMRRQELLDAHAIFAEAVADS